MIRIDAAIVGGGIAGLWALDALHRAGYRAVLVERDALGRGQTVQSQGIIHGGGKYALRGVRDFEAVRTIRDMPARWSRCARGEEAPDLSAARLLSPRCHLWLPKSAGLLQKGLMKIVEKGGLLATPPVRLGPADWPEALATSAAAVWSMDEPVFDARSVVAALADLHRGAIVHAPDVEIRKGDLRVNGEHLAAATLVLTAGAGNASLLEQAGHDAALMQRRPLTMILLRGALPPLHGHCVVGGKTGLTVTSVPTDRGTVWQVGGEIAERTADQPDDSRIRELAVEEIRRHLPGLELAGVEMALYRAVRAESATGRMRRPSGTHVQRLGPGLVVAWPTKLALAPVLAEEILEEVRSATPEPSRAEPLPIWPAPAVSPPPWEEATWSPAR